MKPFLHLIIIIFLLLLFQGCNTLYNSHTIDIEIVEPGRIMFSPDYKKIALKYNNCNVGYNPKFATYFEGDKEFTGSVNTDSIASIIYFEQFTENLIKQDFFDSVVVINPSNFSGVKFIDSLITEFAFVQDSIPNNQKEIQQDLVSFFTGIINLYIPELKLYTSTKKIDPELGLYSKQELKAIKGLTNADLLFSFDFYCSTDGINFFPYLFQVTGLETVVIMAFWNVYDLQEQKLQNFYTKTDTISWRVNTNNLRSTIKKLPPRRDAILNAADIASENFADYLIPHWIEVQRMYYRSNHIDLKKTNQLVEENKWMEAAEIWKANVNNPNKFIEAKSKFNMGLVCEIEGNLDAAIDWIVQSFHVFSSENEVHYYNCMYYIQLLSQRKIDIKKLEMQFDTVEP